MKAKHFLLASALLLWTGVLEAQTYQVPVSEKNEKMQEGEFEPTWESLQQLFRRIVEADFIAIRSSQVA